MKSIALVFLSLTVFLSIGVMAVYFFQPDTVKAEPYSLSVSQVDQQFRYAYFNVLTADQRTFVARYSSAIRSSQIPCGGVEGISTWYGCVEAVSPNTILLNSNLHPDENWQFQVALTMLHEALHLKAYQESNGATYGDHKDIYLELISLTTENLQMNNEALWDYRTYMYQQASCSTAIPIGNGFQGQANCSGKVIYW